MKGNVRLRVEGLLPEKLLQRALSQGARFDVVRRTDERTLLIATDERGAGIIEALCERYGLPATVLRRRGGGWLRERLRQRATLAAGIAVFLALCWLLLGHIWRVDIVFTGEAAVLGDPGPFRAELEDLGIRPGIARSLDAVALSDALAAEIEGYGFVGARVEGVRLLVEAAPEVSAPEVYDVQSPRDLYARQDGIVISAKVESGTLCVKPGDTVRRGQLLIRGEEQLAKEETRPIAALGEVNIRAWYAGEAELPLYETQVTEAGRASTASRLALPWWEWTLEAGQDFADQRVSLERLPIGGLFLPLEIVRETRRETRATAVEADREQLAERLVPLAMADAAAQLTRSGLQDLRIARSWINYEILDERVLHASAVYEIYTNAAVTLNALSDAD